MMTERAVNPRLGCIMDDLRLIQLVIDNATLDEIMKIGNSRKRALMLIRMRLEKIIDVTLETSIENTILDVINDYSKKLSTKNFCGICIQRLLDMPDEDIKRVLVNPTIDTLEQIFITSGGCETQKYIEAISDKKVIAMKCDVCDNVGLEVMKTNEGTYHSCTNCSYLANTEPMYFA